MRKLSATRVSHLAGESAHDFADVSAAKKFTVAGQSQGLSLAGVCATPRWACLRPNHAIATLWPTNSAYGRYTHVVLFAQTPTDAFILSCFRCS